MRTLTLTVAVIVAVVVTSTATAAAATVHVHRGHSIQAAVNSADPGDTIVLDRGRYFQSVGIIKPGITLRGAGSGRHGTVLRQPKSLSGFCFDPTEKVLAGICGGGASPGSRCAARPSSGSASRASAATAWSSSTPRT
jgi:hypothetical protein